MVPLVFEYVLKMIHYFNEVEINGAKFDEKTQVGMILETLSPTFLQFRTNYIMTHERCNLTELLNELLIRVPVGRCSGINKIYKPKFLLLP